MDPVLALRIRSAMVDFEYGPGLGEPDVAAAEHVLRQLGEGELVRFDLQELNPDVCATELLLPDLAAVAVGRSAPSR